MNNASATKKRANPYALPLFERMRADLSLTLFKMRIMIVGTVPSKRRDAANMETTRMR